MKFRRVLFGACLAMLGASSASADMRITQDYGGQIGPYLRRFMFVRESGERVVIDGSCYSACTLVLAVIPPSRICVTPRAALGFHAAWMPDETGRPVLHHSGTRLLWSAYPAPLRNWISRHGGLGARMLILRGRELSAFYRSCT